MRTYWTVQYDAQGPERKVRLIIGNNDYEFAFMLSPADLQDPKGREKVHAWLTGVVFIPGITLATEEAERFLDWLDERFPVPASGLRRPKFRLF